MRLVNIIKVGDLVYSVNDSTRSAYRVLGIQNGKLKLRGFEMNGFYFNVFAFRKVNR